MKVVYKTDKKGTKVTSGPYCPQCGMHIRVAEQHCQDCGIKLDYAHCPHCNNYIARAWWYHKYCVDCGQELPTMLEWVEGK